MDRQQVRSLIVTTSFPPDQGGVATFLGNVAACLSVQPLVLAPAHQPSSAQHSRDREGAESAQSSPDRQGAESASQSQRSVWIKLEHGGILGKLSYRLLWTIHPCLYYLWHFWARASALAGDGVAAVQCGHVFLGLVALALRLRLGLPYVVYAHAQEVRRDRPCGLPLLDTLLRGLVLRRAAAVFVLSSYTRERVLDWGVDPQRIVRLPGGGPLTLPSAAPRTPDPERPLLLTVARLVPRKGIDTVIAALPLLRERYPKTRHVVVGDGPDEARLRGLVRSGGLDDCVIFVGSADRQALADFYAACDLFVMPAREAEDGEVEGFGLVFLEAAAHARPAVAGRSGGQPDAVLDGVTGLLVAPSDPRQLAQAVLRLLEDRPLLERLGQAARQRVEHEATWQLTARQVEETLTRVVRAAKREGVDR